ncbi:adenylosuccinate synthase [Arcanobacterium wilhelmae]|uniref:Adenylosuccinate synthetase n=1 Tax=Arcanobacterium wilhelmae TaxID=1803177 RepID=A0ABT9ND20_9ACTO|nr:adenylosuccinate synthase [Arcanobacterium wilhelmae]MDP9801542.1 adenylosuccinate synthase [Arcanobacterium wilhelmae]WFN90869.1 adenylosuccinate synthase [Arcanobacterium wilhelmae]
MTDQIAAIVGINWGDEGKGRMVDLLAAQYDVVARYQGGGNAGHTVVNEHGTFALHLLPSGIFNPGVINVLGNGVAVNAEQLMREIDDVAAQGVAVTPQNLVVSERASLLLPWHRDRDNLEEARLADKQYGSTKQGIAPFYSDKFAKKTILAGELRNREALRKHVALLLEWENLTLEGVYGAEPTSLDDVMEWIDEWAMRMVPFLADPAQVLGDARAAGKRILFEAQLGALRDIDFGIHPFTTSSNTIAAYAPVGSGLPSARVERVVGVVKAYSTAVGAGPFVCEWDGEKADRLRDAGGEYGATTGRPRRVGPIDIVATRYGVEVQGATEIALTKMDVLSDMDEIPVVEAYELDGERTERFPFPSDLDRARPIETSLPGWRTDISGARTWDELPQEARDYVEYVESKIGARISYVSVGAERDAYIVRN